MVSGVAGPGENLDAFECILGVHGKVQLCPVVEGVAEASVDDHAGVPHPRLDSQTDE